MSIIKNITTYPSTGRTFDVPGNCIQNIAGVFLATSDFFTTENLLSDSSAMFENYSSSFIIPLHYAQTLQTNNEETFIQKSIQDYDYKLRDGKYKHTLRFDWSRALHEIVESYSGTDLYVIYYDNNGNLILAEESSILLRGIKTDSLILQKQLLFGNGSDIAYSDLNIELRQDETIKVIPIDWMPELIDRLFVNIEITSTGVDYLNFIVKDKSANIDILQASDITIVDNVNGEITGILLNYTDGVYQASNFSSDISSGCLTVNATAYLGRIKYRVVIEANVVVDFDLLDGDGFDMLDGEVFELLEKTF